jgi:hypothetical protein
MVSVPNRQIKESNKMAVESVVQPFETFENVAKQIQNKFNSK